MSSPIIQAHQSHPDPATLDPYRVFFPLGILIGVLGVSVWPILAMGWIVYPNPYWHIDLLLQGFIFAFILGFLLTALPRFSQTWAATLTEIVFFAVIFVCGNLATGFSYFGIGRILFLINLTGLFFFAFRRFRKRKSNPPPEFIFVGVGLILGWVAAYIRVSSMWDMSFGISELVGRRLISEGMILMLVLGVGGKLTPMFWGFSSVSPLIPFDKGPALTRLHKIHFALAGLFCFSFFIEYAWLMSGVALYLRAITASFVFFFLMKIHRKPKTSGALVTLLRISNWAICLAMWLAAIYPQYRVDVLHISFIGGFGIMILSIATRVVLSHGKYPTDLERRSVVLALSGIFLVGAMIFRSTAALMGPRYFSFLGFAGTLWIIGLIGWGLHFVPKAITLNRKPNHPNV